ncbi:hypothetical protein HVV49_14245 [Citrobacter freundii]|nr:hypothetical protein [Citrobacter freundii]
MAEPIIIASGVTSATVGITFATMFLDETPGVILCALAGAVMYVLTSEPHQLWEQILFAAISFMGGVSPDIFCSGQTIKIPFFINEFHENALTPLCCI